ncbi:uncharacterized protein LOC126378772 [Pectinophora gossypiella]|uniref:uncharacterized protein LOC126378772 n=1 Tax=Pectinophora gossypiella TaxID=13191 RepID=UPI00214EA57E|nr:uncharacterized protein LOC126378772 [Pectinophora gossypiella]
MDKPSFKLVGAPCGHHGQYTFYKALRLTGARERILAIGDFFFVRIWQDSELVSIGELQLLWTDRVSDQTLVSLRLYFLPENTPDGRSQHGEDEVLALNEKVVVRASDLVSWFCSGEGFGCGLRAVWRGACAPPPPAAPASDPLHHTSLDFSDIDKEKSLIEEDVNSPGVVVFSYPRYCRYRALLARLEGIQAAWLRDSLVAALGGYAASTNNTSILYCKETFEYPELEGHEFVCNHLAPRLKGRPRGRRRRALRSRDHTPCSRSSDSEPDAPEPEPKEHKISPRRLSLRNGASDKQQSSSEEEAVSSPEDRQFLQQLRQFYRPRQESRAVTHALKHLSLRSLYSKVSELGGYEAVCRGKLWREVHADRPARVRSLYERFLLQYENHERRNGRLKPNGKIEDEKQVIDTIEVGESRSPTPTGEVVTSHTAEQLNREFLESLPQHDKQSPLGRTGGSLHHDKPTITVKHAAQLIDPDKQKQSVIKLFEEHSGLVEELSAKYLVSSATVVDQIGGTLAENSSLLLKELQQRLGDTETTFLKDLTKTEPSSALSSLSTLGDKYAVNGHTPNGAPPDQLKAGRPAGRSSLRAVRVKPTRPAHSAANTPPVGPLRPDSASSSPPSLPSITNFGVHHPPPQKQNSNSDDEIVEVPYKPKTPEIIDLDEYPESPQSTKKKKLDILKERGLQVTALPATWSLPPTGLVPHPLNPAVQHQIMTQASLFQMYNIIPQNYANGIQPPKVIQATCTYGTSGPEKTVYGNPKDPFMLPPHILHGVPIKPQKTVTTEKQDTPVLRQDVLDLTCKAPSPPAQKPAVEIVRIPPSPSPKVSQAQNLSKNYTLIDGKAVVGSNLEITLVNPKSQTPPKNRQPQKRSSNGKFVSTKTPTPPKDYPKPYPSPSGAKLSPSVKKSPIIVPNYQINRDEISPTSSSGSRDSQTNMMQSNLLQNVFKGQNNLQQIMDLQKSQSLGPSMGPMGPNLGQMMDMQKSVSMTPFMDPMYMSALYSSLAGQMDQRQLAMYRELMATQFRYSGLLGGVATPTTKN